jgi:hypothetical protein
MRDPTIAALMTSAKIVFLTQAAFEMSRRGKAINPRLPQIKSKATYLGHIELPLRIQVGITDKAE